MARMDRDRLAEIAAAHGVELVVQFGSTVTGHAHDGSDADVAVLLKRAPASYDEHTAIAAALQPLFTGLEIDLVVLNHADPLLLKQVTEHGVLLRGDPTRWQEFRLLAFKRYQDHRRFLQMERDYVERAVAGLHR
jgi:predicted nucleotidyltransferase